MGLRTPSRQRWPTALQASVIACGRIHLGPRRPGSPPSLGALIFPILRPVDPPREFANSIGSSSELHCEGGGPPGCRVAGPRRRGTVDRKSRRVGTAHLLEPKMVGGAHFTELQGHGGPSSEALSSRFYTEGELAIPDSIAASDQWHPAPNEWSCPFGTPNPMKVPADAGMFFAVGPGLSEEPKRLNSSSPRRPRRGSGAGLPLFLRK